MAILLEVLGLALLALLAALAIFDPFNSVNRLVLLVGMFLAAALVYLAYGFCFLGLSYLIVYSGAIAIIFLFVVMTLDIKGSGRRGGLLWLAAIGAGLASALPAEGSASVMTFAPELAAAPFASTDIVALGVMLYEGLPVAVILIGFALWAVLVGVINVLGGREGVEAAHDTIEWDVTSVSSHRAELDPDRSSGRRAAQRPP